MMSSGTTPYLDYWVATRPIAGENESGDQYVVAPFENGVLVAAIDGLGHGEEACASARFAAQVLAAYAHEPVVSLMQRCHEELRKARGAVISIASFDAVAGTMSWIGVGNVEGLLLGSARHEKPRRASLVPRGGIVGDRLPNLVPSTVEIQCGDLLVFATDGIGSMFVRDVRHMEHPRQLVHHIFIQHAKTTDDALILGAQWTNGGMATSRDEAMNRPIQDSLS